MCLPVFIPLNPSVFLPYILVTAYTWQLFWIAKTSSGLAIFSWYFKDMVHYTLASTLLWWFAVQTIVVSLPSKVSLTLEFGIFHHDVPS